MLTVGSCFSGIGGLEIGLEWTGGFETKWQIELDPYATRVLEKHWPHAKRETDIRTVNKLESVDLICGGFPCQDVSLAGARAGLEGKRSTLWGEMYRLVCEFRPKWVLAENVPGLLSSDVGRFFGNILRDLASIGYDAEWGVLSAAGVGAPHLRRRIFVLAHSSSKRRWGGPQSESEGKKTPFRSAEVANTHIKRLERIGSGGPGFQNGADKKMGERGSEQKLKRSDWWSIEPNVGVRVDGLSTGLDGGGIDADAKENRPHSLLRSVLDKIDPKNVRQKVRGQGGIFETALLRPEMYEQSLCQRHAILVGLAETSYQIPWEELRIVWGYDQHSRPSHRRELAERLAKKHPDLVRELSRFPPPPCSACWKDDSWEAGIERVSRGVPNRVDRLKCLGNAVVPQVAQKIGEMILNYET